MPLWKASNPFWGDTPHLKTGFMLSRVYVSISSCAFSGQAISALHPVLQIFLRADTLTCILKLLSV